MNLNIEELEKWRTVQEARNYYKHIISWIHSDDDLTRDSRLKVKKLAFKELFEEYYYLLIFAELFYKDENIKCRYVGAETQPEGKMKYDGEVLRESGKTDKIEITAPRDGYKENKQAKELNASGITDIEIYDLHDKLDDYKKRIIACADKKSGKDYKDVLLVFVIESWTYYYPTINMEIQFIEEIIKELKKKNYTARKVFMMIPPYESPVNKFDGMIYRVI